MRYVVVGLLAGIAAGGVAAGECARHGTQVEFVDSPREAAARARKDEKLVFVLHVSGHFEDPRFTWNNAEALRVGALANVEVGKYLNEHFVSSYQKVATFRILASPNGPATKQGGNVAAYFCAPDGRVLHAVAGPVDAATLLREARWVVDTVRTLMKDSGGDGAKFKAAFRTAHAVQLRADTGLTVEPTTWDAPDPTTESTLTYRDPTGRPLAPKLPPPPIDGPDVRLGAAEFAQRQTATHNAPGARELDCRLGRRVVVNNQAIVHQLLAAHALVRIEQVYGTVFENILGEQVSTRPVDVVSPFPWLDRGGNRVVR